MVEGCHSHTPPTTADRSRNSIEQRHRVEPAGNGDNDSPVLWKRACNYGWQVWNRHRAHFAIGRAASIFPAPSQREILVNSNGPLGVLWVGIALGAFYIALIWLNTLLGFFLTPLFLIPQTWLMDFAARRRAQRADRDAEHLSSY
jgi:hypothetical protein